QPQVGAKAAIVTEASTGRVIFWQNADQPLPMASTTKLMTTLMVLEEKDLDQPFVVDQQAIRVEGSSMGLQQGDTVTLRTLCYGMMLASGNDAANAAAVRCAGSVEEFVERMNQKAAELGMKDTNFVTPSGLDAEGHQSTAHDMALLMAAALQNPDFCQIASAQTARLEYGNPPYGRTLTNHNKLLWNCEGTVGGKTGFTKKAGRCLVSAAQREGMTLVCVTLGCPDDWNVQAQLYDRCFELLEPLPLQQEEIQIPVAGSGKKIALCPEQKLVLPLTKQELELVKQVVLAPSFLYAPVPPGQRVGEVRCYMGSTLVLTTDLVAGQGAALDFVPKAKADNLWQRLTRKYK
ncbi:MAG: D-alanyl-D-alanine carboxypeptidase, partial [Oscillospiraceae bacterium]|nr:D-alanyl-D-alanine carboxypeptidase [Oscillospiraceae bacterium]